MTFLVDALAVFRLTRLVLQDDITAPLREKVRHAAMRSVDSPGVAAKLNTLISCPWCVSPYCAAMVFCARRLMPRAWAPVAEVLAASAITGLVAENLG